MAYNNNYSRNNRYNNGFRNNGNNFHGGNVPSGYVGAPYNFVPFYKNVVEVEKEKMPVHGVITDELITGEIDYTVTAKTDILIDDGNAHFHKNARGEYSIPGSTMRGLIRNNVQILGLSSFDDDIDDYRLMYRNVANGVEKKYYNEVLGSKQVSISPGSKPVGALTNVKGGYIVKKGSKYYIYMTVIDKLNNNLKEMNYYILSERTVAKNIDNYPFIKKHPEAAAHIVKSGFRKEEDRRGKVHYKGDRNPDYKPNYYEVSYEIANVKNVTSLGEPGQFSNEGYLIASGPMNEKKNLYVIPKIDMNKEPIEISEQDINSYKIDFENKKNTLKRTKNVDFFNLPRRDNDFKPVFYIRLDGKLYFGFTPRLRLFYEHSIKDGFKQKKCEFDYAKSIFGCVAKDKTGYKSKVSFSDAVAVQGADEANGNKIILASPKPTSYLDYIVQGENATTYNTDDFELRGVKQYWLHKDVVKVPATDKEKAVSTINPIKAGTVFKGKVRFNNLTKDELGLLLWSIRLNRNSWMNVGKAKAFGYGNIAISDLNLKTLDLKRAYSLDETLDVNPMVDGNIDELIDVYKETINSKLTSAKIDELQSVKDFFAMKDSDKIPKEANIRYMSIDNKEYQNRKEALKNVMEIINKK